MWKRNDRFFVVATHAPAPGHLHALDDLRPDLVDGSRSFFIHYAGFNGNDITHEALLLADHDGDDRGVPAGVELIAAL